MAFSFRLWKDPVLYWFYRSWEICGGEYPGSWIVDESNWWRGSEAVIYSVVEMVGCGVFLIVGYLCTVSSYEHVTLLHDGGFLRADHAILD